MSRELKCRYDLRHSSSANGPPGHEQPTEVILQCVVQELNDLLLERGPWNPSVSKELGDQGASSEDQQCYRAP